jgi:hypothetical protein
MRYPKRSQYRYVKSRYRVQNWAQYEAGHQMRGVLTVWLSDVPLETRRAPAIGRPGGQHTDPDLAIEAAGFGGIFTWQSTPTPARSWLRTGRTNAPPIACGCQDSWTRSMTRCPPSRRTESTMRERSPRLPRGRETGLG